VLAGAEKELQAGHIESLTSMTAIQSLLAGLFDYAGLYPPASLGMSAAAANYLEYASDRDCDNGDSCQHVIVFGCMDPMSCNYDPAANVNVPSLCCYPGKCNDRDIALVCPQLTSERRNGLEFSVFPNPSTTVLNVRSTNANEVTRYVIYNSVGQKITEHLTDHAGNSFYIDISSLKKGIYMLRVFNDKQSNGQLFVKE